MSFAMWLCSSSHQDVQCIFLSLDSEFSHVIFFGQQDVSSCDEREVWKVYLYSFYSYSVPCPLEWGHVRANLLGVEIHGASWLPTSEQEQPRSAVPPYVPQADFICTCHAQWCTPLMFCGWFFPRIIVAISNWYRKRVMSCFLCQQTWLEYF